jgi:hypothetical protein
MADCGMGVAVDIRVIHEHVLAFYRRTGGGYDEGAFITKAFWGLLVCRAAAEGVPGTSDNLSANLAWGEIAADSGATNLLRGSLIKARCRLVSWE